MNEKEYLENEKTLPIVLPILEQSFSSVQAFLHAVDDDRIGSQEPVVCDRASANWALRSKKKFCSNLNENLERDFSFLVEIVNG